MIEKKRMKRVKYGLSKREKYTYIENTIEVLEEDIARVNCRDEKN